MKNIEVVAAIIKRGNKIFTTQRGYGDFKGKWEFPGGKIEKGETLEAALEREILEELDTKIKIIKLVDTIDYNYPDFHFIMHCFLCTIESGNLVLKEHEASKWLSKEELDSVDWLPADFALIRQIKNMVNWSNVN